MAVRAFLLTSRPTRSRFLCPLAPYWGIKAIFPELLVILPVCIYIFPLSKMTAMGKFLNELEIKNTLDPSPYLGLSLNANENPDEIPVCGK